MLDIHTYDARSGGNVLYKALAHPLVAEALALLGGRLRRQGSLAVFDPEGAAAMLFALHPDLPAIAELYVQDVGAVGRELLGSVGRPLTTLPESHAATLLVTSFDGERILSRIRHLIPLGMQVVTLDAARLPDEMLTSDRAYLDRLNFATNYAFFRDSGGLSTRLVTANYWAAYGATQVRLWLRLFDADGVPLATWEEAVPHGPGGIVIESSVVRRQFGLGDFTGT